VTPGATAGAASGGRLRPARSGRFPLRPGLPRGHRLWRDDDGIYAELALPPGEAATAGRYGIHPVLLDSALHAGLLADPPEQLRVPFTLTGVEVHTAGAATARVTLTRLGPDESRVTLTDENGRPVLTIDSLVTRVAEGESAATATTRRPCTASTGSRPPAAPARTSCSVPPRPATSWTGPACCSPAPWPG